MVRRLALREIPTTTRLFADYCEGRGTIRSLLPRHFRDPDAFEAQARLLDGRRYDRRLLCQVLREQNERMGSAPQALRAVDRLGDPAALAVIGGQQAGLFGGPLYTLHKALTILVAARQAEERLSRPVVPLFWIASEDSDLAEVNHAWVIDREGSLQPLRMPAAAEAKVPVSRVRLGEEIGSLLDALVDLLPEGDQSKELIEELRAAYTPGRTYPQAFGAWMARLFGPLGLALVDPSDARLKGIAQDLFDEEIRDRSPVSAAVIEQTARLRAAGYDPQIDLREGFLTLFYQDPAREAITITDGGFELKTSGRRFTPGELSTLLQRSPEAFTPNAVMRPLFQDTLFPTLAAVLGPAEIAYFTQLTRAYERLGVPMPLLVPRCSLTLVEHRIERLRIKLGLSLVQLLERGERVVDDILARKIPASLAQRIAEGRTTSETLWAGILEDIDALDPTLHRTAEIGAARSRLQYDFIEKKVVQASRRKDQLLRRQVGRLVASLAPRRGLQERTLCALPFLALYGRRILEVAREAIEAEGSEHLVVVIDP